jgi:hypothetical protein
MKTLKTHGFAVNKTTSSYHIPVYYVFTFFYNVGFFLTPITFKNMATATTRLIFPEGTLVSYKNKLCIVAERNQNYGYNVYKVRELDGTYLHTAFSWELDHATSEEQFLADEFNKDFMEPEDSASKRFYKIKDTDKTEFIQQQKNSNTIKKTRLHSNLFKSYLKFVDELREPELLPPAELNNHLENFFVTVRKEDGSQYEPSSIRGILGSLHRYFQEKKYAESIMTAPTFSGMRDAIAAKFKVRLIIEHNKTINCTLLYCTYSTQHTLEF